MLPGGVGGFEPAMLALLPQLSQARMPQGVAAAATILVRLATLWFAVGVGASPSRSSAAATTATRRSARRPQRPADLTPPPPRGGDCSPPMSGPARWLDVKEKGGVLGVRFVVWLCTAFGRAPARAFLALLCVYYVAFHGAVRRASRAYLRRVGRPNGFWDVYRHVLTFARCALDRFFFLTGRHDLFSVESHGTEHLRAAQEAGRGAVLLGAHLQGFQTRCRR